MFDEPERAANYADGPSKFVPGFADVHCITTILLQECAPEDARILVHVAGGGLGLNASAHANPGWTFVGVAPRRRRLTRVDVD